MTLPNTFTAGTDALASQVNSNFVYNNTVWEIENLGAFTFNGVVVHSATNYSVVRASSGEIYLWDGSTLTLKNSTPNASSLMAGCKADATHGVCVETAGVEVTFTDDSGATWTSKTSVGFSAAVYDVSFPTATLIVVGGSDGGGDYIQFSTDDGGTWTDATTSPSTVVDGLDMFDGNTGYAVDSSGNIWKTTNAAVDWTDTGDNVSTGTPGASCNVLCLTADIVIITSQSYLDYYVNSTNTVTRKVTNGTLDLPQGIVNTDGVIYALMSNSSNHMGGLLTSADSGITWTYQIFDPSSNDTAYKHSIAAYDTGKIMYIQTGDLYKQDRSNL